MQNPLPDNPAHLRQLCAALQLGSPLSAPAPVKGGFHHRMWMLDTSGGQYAIKQLAAELDPGDPSTVAHFDRTEAVAGEFQRRGIPAVVARKRGDHYLQTIEDAAYLVYPWVQARALHRSEIDDRHVAQVAELFAAMHRASIDIPGLAGEEYAVLSADRLNVLVQFARSRNCRRSRELEQDLDWFLQLVQRHGEAVEFLSAHTLASHGDLDHKNILWTAAGEPLIIDWESAHRLNPTHEIVLEALDWSGITLDFNEARFMHMLSVYLEAGGRGAPEEVEAALHCVQGDWLNWLMYNVGRSIDMDDTRQRRIGSEQLDLALATLKRLKRLVPRLLARLA
ncbi:aminoglycoside phosphotransferase family protein [Seongchinamella sediminis]|uniref:Aminoglycoside phosphotransferase family protein n=1 Tax=Seongchinamella sediminis TaxID=2283635 RepID=A0A3L7DZF0_9GAMM|nr:aminoglycoside phosphotransferase family protein [Seongchinamella sediminis]RLQ22049.1 aminoglycoside phosphotransferase family protein [Seongchinamella sediminis]